MDPIVTTTLLIVNAVLAIGVGVPLARRLARILPSSKGPVVWVAALWGVYLAECVAFSASMATNVLGFALAIVWGVVFGRHFRQLPRERANRLALAVSVYSCLPAVSFLSVLVLLAVGGWPILTAEGGRRLGIPQFVPWPVCTVAGFFVTVVGSALAVKTALTTVLAMRISRRSQQSR